MADDMDIHQTPLLDEEHKNLKSDCLEDDSFNPPNKRMKYALPSEKPDMPVLRWRGMINFQLYTILDVEVYKGIIAECRKEIEACELAIQAAEKHFDTEFGDLEKKQPNHWSTEVVRYFNVVKKTTHKCLLNLKQLLPDFEETVKTYIRFREGPLQNCLDAVDQRSKKLMELAEKPNVANILDKIYKDEDNKKGDHTKHPRLKLLLGEVIVYLRERGIPYARKDAKSKEHDDESKKEDLLVQDECEIFVKDLITIHDATIKAQVDMKEYVEKNQHRVYDFVRPMEIDLKALDSRIKIMHRQLKLLVDKNVIRNGYDFGFFDEWRKVSYPVGRSGATDKQWND